jgi:predicted AAA+ superfamily ATPase
LIDTYTKVHPKEIGRLFECMIINEFFKLNHYVKKMFDFSYINADEDSEVDLIIEKARKVIYLVEIKSSKNVKASDIKNLLNYKKDFPNAKCICLSEDKNQRIENEIHFMTWQNGLKFIFG